MYFSFVAGRANCRAELYIDRGDKEENKFIFDQLYLKKESIEAAFDKSLTWQRLDERRACRIKCETSGNIFDPDQWPTLIEFMTDAMVRMEKTFKEPLADINQQLQKREKASLAPIIS
jgi:CRISPR/Cas system-associated endonuclease/helicase Cas3